VSTESIAARLAAATPGQWRVEECSSHHDEPEDVVIVADNKTVVSAAWCNDSTADLDITLADADLIAHAPDDLRALLAVAVAAEALRDRMNVPKHLKCRHSHDHEGYRCTHPTKPHCGGCYEDWPCPEARLLAALDALVALA
jgi:hypothetical protein